VLFVGLDWAEEHHDLAVMDELGRVVTARRVVEGLAGLTVVHELVAAQVEDPAQVVIGTETDRGLFVGALVAAGYQGFRVPWLPSAPTWVAAMPGRARRGTNPNPGSAAVAGQAGRHPCPRRPPTRPPGPRGAAPSRPPQPPAGVFPSG
jgi:hypothetical protein